MSTVCWRNILLTFCGGVCVSILSEHLGSLLICGGVCVSILSEHLGSLLICGGVCVSCLFNFLCVWFFSIASRVSELSIASSVFWSFFFWNKYGLYQRGDMINVIGFFYSIRDDYKLRIVLPSIEHREYWLVRQTGSFNYYLNGITWWLQYISASVIEDKSCLIWCQWRH